MACLNVDRQHRVRAAKPPYKYPLPLPVDVLRTLIHRHLFRLLLSSRSCVYKANAVSGMAVDDDCKLKFLELKAKRTHRFIVYKIDEKLKQVVVEKLGEPTMTYDDFTACLPEKECRYAIFDIDFLTAENVPKSKIFFVAWSPDTARVRSKMLYASSKERFKRELIQQRWVLMLFKAARIEYNLPDSELQTFQYK